MYYCDGDGDGRRSDLKGSFFTDRRPSQEKYRKNNLPGVCICESCGKIETNPRGKNKISFDWLDEKGESVDGGLGVDQESGTGDGIRANNSKTDAW